MPPKPRLLLLHGFLATSVSWRPLIAAIGDDADCIAPDLPGYGCAPAPPGAYTLDSVTASLTAVVEREHPTYILGHSMGAIVALALAASLPGAFQRVGVAGLPVFHSRTDARAVGLRNRGVTVRAFLQDDNISHLVCGVLNISRPAWAPIGRRFAPGEAPAILATKFEHTRTGHAGGVAEILLTRRLSEIARALSAPVTVFHGSGDLTAPIERAQALAIDHGWQFTTAPGAGHQFVVTQPELAAAWVRDALFAPVAPAQAAAS